MLPKMLGEFQANIVPKNGKVLQETIYVTKGTGGSLPHIIVNLSNDIPVCVRTTRTRPSPEEHLPTSTRENQRHRSSQPAQHGEPLLSTYQGIRHYHSTFTGADTERYTSALDRETQLCPTSTQTSTHQRTCHRIL